MLELIQTSGVGFLNWHFNVGKDEFPRAPHDRPRRAPPSSFRIQRLVLSFEQTSKSNLAVNNLPAAAVGHRPHATH